jgi:hypothetical protein
MTYYTEVQTIEERNALVGHPEVQDDDIYCYVIERSTAYLYTQNTGLWWRFLGPSGLGDYMSAFDALVARIDALEGCQEAKDAVEDIRSEYLGPVLAPDDEQAENNT